MEVFPVREEHSVIADPARLRDLDLAVLKE